MNVTSTGYYTSSYLNQQMSKRRQHIPYDQYYSSYYHNDIEDNSIRDEEIKTILSSPKSRAVSEKPRVPSKTSLYSQSSSPPSSSKSSRPTISAYSSDSSLGTSEMFVADDDDEVESEEESDDPDRLAEELTPAHLNYLATQPQYVPYRPSRRDPYQPQPLSPVQQIHYVARPRVRPNKNGDYYINQQKKYDKASGDMKPRLYSHKTFKDVFINKDEKLDRYNPMDLVFEGRDTNANGNKFLKNVQTILKKDDYNDYNYYDHKMKEKKKKSPVKEVFVSDVEDDDSDIESIDQETFLNEEQRKMIKKNSTLKKAWKKKIAKAKKELGRDFDKFAIKQNEIEHQLKEKKEKEKAAKKEAKEKEKTAKKGKKEDKKEEAKDQEKEEKKEEKKEDKKEEKKEEKEDKKEEKKEEKEEKKEEKKEEHKKADDKFSPGWNYLLSLVKYDRPSEPNKEKEEKEAPKPKPKPAPVMESPYTKNTRIIKKNLKGFTKNSKIIFGNWNQPVANVLTGELAKTDKKKVSKPASVKAKSVHSKSIHSKSIHSKSIHSNEEVYDDVESKEFVIECDSDNSDEDIAEELYYNPITKQLEPTPPTSSSSMEVDDSEAASVHRLPIMYQTMTHARSLAGRFLNLDPHTPLAVVSNFVSLIKKIDIMRRVFSPIDIIGEWFPQAQTLVIFLELGIFMWILFELSRLIDALCMMIKAFCAPMIAIGRFMNKII